MKSPFNPGDRVIVIALGHHYGTICTVTDKLCYMYNLRAGKWCWVYPVDIAPRNPTGVPGECIAFLPEHLIPYNDGNEPAQWEDCVWKPTECEVVTNEPT